MSILVHSCCGPCLGGSIETLKNAAGNETIESFWYNPNIHPYLEYRQRLLSFDKLCKALKIKPNYTDIGYGLEFFLRNLDGKFGEERCFTCYRMRLEPTARFAAANGFDSFTTTLLISPYQQHELIIQASRKAAEEHSTRFFYVDLRPAFKQTYQVARDQDLYRQKYCGCIFSEYSRFNDDKRFQLPEIK